MRSTLLIILATLGMIPVRASGQQRFTGARSAPVAAIVAPRAYHEDERAAAPMPSAIPGSIATLSFAIPGKSRTGPARFTLSAAEGVRLFGDTLGTLDADADGMLPITFSVPAGRNAGGVDIAQVTVLWADGSRWTGVARASVLPRYALRMNLRVDDAVPVKGRMRVSAFITNGGNVTDTVRVSCDAGALWAVACDGNTMIVPAGAVVQRSITLSWPTSTSPGDARLLHVSAKGAGNVATASLLVRVPATMSNDDRWMTAATSVFVGSDTRYGSSGSGSLALESTVQLDPESWLALALRKRGTDGGSGARVFATEMNGGGSRVDFRRPGLGVRAGDVLRPIRGLLDALAVGQGIDVDVSAGQSRIGALVTQSHAGSEGVFAKQTAQIEASTDTRYGSFGVQASQLRGIGSNAGADETAQSLGVRLLSAEGSRQRFSLDVGAIRIAGPQSHTDPAIDLSYDAQPTPGGASVNARLRQTTAAYSNAAVMPNLTSVGAALPLSSMLTVTVAGSSTSRRIANDSTERADAISGAVVLNARGVSSQMAASEVGDRRIVSGSVWLPLRRLVIDLFAQKGLGVARDSSGRDHVQGGARWTMSSGWLWTGMSFSRDVQLETAGALLLGTHQVEFGTTGVSSLWSRFTTPIRNGLQIVSGIEHTSLATAGGSWRLLAGVKQTLAVPLPVRRPAAANGVVFEDMDNDGVRDAGEPAVAGVIVRFGDDHLLTGITGTFAFPDRGQRADHLDVDLSSLPEGLVLPPAAKLPLRGQANIALVRTGSLVVVLRARRADGTLTSEILAPDGCVVSAVSADGRTRDETARAGVATFDGMMPGEYSVSIPGSEGSTTMVRIQPGQRARIDVAAPAAREIRFGPAPR